MEDRWRSGVTEGKDGWREKRGRTVIISNGRTLACWGRRERGRAAGGANTTLTRCDMHDQKHVTSKDTTKRIVTLN